MTEEVLWSSGRLPTLPSGVRARGWLRALAPQIAALETPLPRAMRTWDVFAYNVYFTSFALALVYLYMTALQVAPPAHLVSGVLIGGVLASFPVATYAMLAALMPRAGGDYVYASRVLHPVLGFLASWNWVVWLCFWIGFGGYTLSTVGLGGSIASIALGTSHTGLLDLARILGRGDVAFSVGTVVIAISGVLVSLGMGAFLRVQRWTFLLAIGAIAVTAVALATTETARFRARFDLALHRASGIRGAYAAVAGAAESVTIGSGSALDVVPAAFLVLPWTIGSVFIAPEVKDVRRAQPLGMFAALGAVTGVTALLGHLLVRSAGPEFLLGLATGAGERLGVPVHPYLHELAFLLVEDPRILVGTVAGFLCLGWMYIAQNMITNARILMAWALDGLAPRAWAEVHPGLHTPWRSTLAVCLAGEVFLALACFTPYVHLLSSILALSLSAALAALSAVLLPFRRPELLRGVAARRIAGIPLLTGVGVGALGALVYVDVRFLLDARYGANNPESIGAVVVVLATGLLYRHWAGRRWGKGR